MPQLSDAAPTAAATPCRTWRRDAPPAPWQIEAVAVPALPPLRGRVDVDVAIVGGGLAGLATAYALHSLDPAARVAVVEEYTIGAGATGRSTGVAGPAIGGPITLLRRRYGDQLAAAMFAATLDAVERTVALVRNAGIDCDLEVPGQLVTALTPAHDGALRRQAELFAAYGFDVPYLDRAAVTARINSPRYLGALLYPTAATLDPVALCRGLRAQLVADGVAVFEQTRAVRLRPTASGRSGAGGPGRHVVETPDGALHAEHVVIATDAYGRPPGTRGPDVVPLDTHVLRTAPLRPEAFAELGWSGREALVDSRTFFSYARLTRDNRLVFGGGPVMYRSPADRRAAAGSESRWHRLTGDLGRQFPVLRDVEITDRWFGTTGVTLDRLPVVGPVPGTTGAWFAGGWCGHGVALSVLTGWQLAGVLTGSAAPPALPWWRGRPPVLPPEPLRGPGLRAYITGLDVRDRLALAWATRTGRTA